MSRRPKPRRGGMQPVHHAQDLAKALKDLPRARCLRPDKVPYRSLKAAQSAAEKQWLADRRILTPYVCVDHYHLTSQRTQPKKQGSRNV